MLSPDARQVATEILRPPVGYTLDRTIMTSYSLDLEVVLALPLAVLAQSDQGVEELLQDPLLLLEALREASDRVHIFVDESGIALPHVQRELYAALEGSVHPVRAPNKGAFHPKLWVARFTREGDDDPLLRVAVASRNLTFDRSWDVALVSEARPGQQTEPGSQPLTDFLQQLPKLGRQPLNNGLADALEGLADELGQTRFPGPEGFDGGIDFQVLGLGTSTGSLWRPVPSADRVLAVAPFVNRSGLDALTESGAGSLSLISREEALEELPEGTLTPWQEVQVLQEAALEEPDDDTAGRPAGLHAKLIVAEHGNQVYWHVGSANLTRAAFNGRNVEIMARLRGKVGSTEVERGVGIDSFRAGFDKLCTPFQSVEAPVEEGENEELRSLERTRDALLDCDLRVCCEAYDKEWDWWLAGELPDSEGVVIDVWPVTLPSNQARTWPATLKWRLSIEQLTAFVAFRLRKGEDVEPLTLVAKLPARGLPEQRMRRILRKVIRTPERFLAFLRALLGGLDELVDWVSDRKVDPDSVKQSRAPEAETLLEDLLRTAAHDPERLAVVRQVVTDLMADEEDSQVVPQKFRAIWQAMDAALQKEPHS